MREDFVCEQLGNSTEALRASLANRLIYSVGKDAMTAQKRDWFMALAYVVRDRLMKRWMETMRRYYSRDVKRIYYFSLEFLIGRTLGNSLLNMQIYDEARKVLRELGYELEDLIDVENDAALGNGGLGRLAACFLDSMATLDLPGFGYGIRYEYGMFHQHIEDGKQIESPDNWLRYGNPWEFPRPEVLYPVHFGGRVVSYKDEMGVERTHWVDTTQVMAMAYDTPIPGYGADTVNNMRLWSAKASREFDLKYFNEGNYIKAVEEKNQSENLSKVLYPVDTTPMGRELRLKQQYFFVSASLQDIIFRFRKFHDDWDKFPSKVAIQLNDTHPSVAIPELMRLLVDIHNFEWSHAWNLTQRTFAYTNHTLMPEALETWTLNLFGRLLPRHLQIIFQINHEFLQLVSHQFPGDVDMLARVSMIDESGERRIRMANLAIVGSHKVNGVARLHTDLMKKTIFRDFDRLYPDKIVNRTNGITPRRWLHQINRNLSGIITEAIGQEWVQNLELLDQLERYQHDNVFLEKIASIKFANKQRLVGLVKKYLSIKLDPETLFDVHVKRIHEYKRQLLNILHVIALYNRIRSGDNSYVISKTVIFSGKAAPGYEIAKLIVRLINDVADVVNNDPAIHDQLKVVFIPNYDVTTAGDIIPAAEISEQISTAGTEASGTGNMKLALNGAITLGTMDGANIEIAEAVGRENVCIFGMNADEVRVLKQNNYDPADVLRENEELAEVINMIRDGFFSPADKDRYRPLIDSLMHSHDRYCVFADFTSYMECQVSISSQYQDEENWNRRSLLNIARMGHFSSDRTIMEYAQGIWDVKVCNQ